MKVQRMRVNLVMAVLVVALVGAAAMPAQTIGVVLDDGKNIVDPFGGLFGGSNDDASTVYVFRADTNTVLGNVNVNLTTGPTATGILSDCSLSGDAKTAFVGYINQDPGGSTSKELIAVDISTPAVPTVSTRIGIATSSVDTSITHDGKFVLVCDSVNPEAVSVVDAATEASVGSYAGQVGCRAVEACSDGSVLIGRPDAGMLHRLSIDAAGTLTDTGESIAGFAPQNVDCAPSAASGVFVSDGYSAVYSVANPLAGVADSEGTTDGEGVVVLVHPDGNRVFVRSAGGDIDVFDYDQATGVMTPPTVAFTIAAAAPTRAITSTVHTDIEQGVDTMAFTPDGSKLYVVAGTTVQVFNATDGTSLGSFGSFDSPTGICFARGAAGPPPPGAVVIDINPGGDCIKNDGKGVIPVAIYGSTDFDVTQIDFSTVELESLTVKMAGKSGNFQVEFSDLNLDSFTDVVVKLDDSASVLPSGDIEVTLTGALLDGTEFEGAQTICVK